MAFATSKRRTSGVPSDDSQFDLNKQGVVYRFAAGTGAVGSLPPDKPRRPRFGARAYTASVGLRSTAMRRPVDSATSQNDAV